MTARQAKAWEEWREFEELRPTTADSYVMQLTDVVSQVVQFLQCGRAADPDKWRIDFTVGPPKEKPDPDRPKTQEEVMRQADEDVAAMIAMFGGVGRVKGAEKFMERKRGKT